MLPTIYPQGEIYIRLNSWCCRWTDKVSSLAGDAYRNRNMNMNDRNRNRKNGITSAASRSRSKNVTCDDGTAVDNDDDEVQSQAHAHVSIPAQVELPTTEVEAEAWWKVGDVIVLRDFKGCNVCKRIIAVEGQVVDTLGQFATTLYRHEDDYGVRRIIERPGLELELPNSAWRDKYEYKYEYEKGNDNDDDDDNDSGDQIDNNDDDDEGIIVIPRDHIWVEGDSPLHSIDSRHYGPVHTDAILGKIVYRIWPRTRNDGNSCWQTLDGQRPDPLTDEDMFRIDEHGCNKYDIIRHPYAK